MGNLSRLGVLIDSLEANHNASVEAARQQRRRRNIFLGSTAVISVLTGVAQGAHLLPPPTEWGPRLLNGILILQGVTSEFDRWHHKRLAKHYAQMAANLSDAAGVVPPEWAGGAPLQVQEVSPDSASAS